MVVSRRRIREVDEDEKGEGDDDGRLRRRKVDRILELVRALIWAFMMSRLRDSGERSPRLGHLANEPPLLFFCFLFLSNGRIGWTEYRRVIVGV